MDIRHAGIQDLVKFKEMDPRPSWALSLPPNIDTCPGSVFSFLPCADGIVLHGRHRSTIFLCFLLIYLKAATARRT